MNTDLIQRTKLSHEQLLEKEEEMECNKLLDSTEVREALEKEKLQKHLKELEQDLKQWESNADEKPFSIALNEVENSPLDLRP